MAYDERRGLVVLFGGRRDNPNEFPNDTWEWNGGKWTQSAHGPAGRADGRMVYDRGRGTVLLFGGGNQQGKLSDTWEYDGTSWRQLVFDANKVHPDGRLGHGMTYDTTRGVTVLFGGMGTSGALRDTWVLRFPQRGDLNCNCALDFADINPFVLALSDPEEHTRQFPDCDAWLADCNYDGRTDFGDINAFVELLSGEH